MSNEGIIKSRIVYVQSIIRVWCALVGRLCVYIYKVIGQLGHDVNTRRGQRVIYSKNKVSFPVLSVISGIIIT